MSTEMGHNHETLEGCPFCEILSGKMEGFVLKRRENTSMILALEGHPLVVTNGHQKIVEVDSETSAEIGAEITGQNIERAIDYFQADGINVHFSLGKAAGQELEHAHIHLIPRYHNDQVGKFPKGLSIKSFEERQKIAQGLSSVLNSTS